MAIFGGFNITKRRPDTSSMDQALRLYHNYKSNKANNEAAIERERIKAEAELRKALLRAEADAAKAAAKAGDKGKLDPTKFVQSLMANYPGMTKDEAIGLYGQLLSGSTMTSNDNWWENRDRGGRVGNGDAMEDISKGKSRDKAEPQVDFTEWKRNRIKKLTKVAVSGKTNPYEFQDEEGKTVVLSQSAYNDAMKNGTEGKVYVPAQGRFMTEAEAEGWAKRVARASNKIKPTISGVDDGSTNDGSNTNMDGSQNEAITFDFAPRANESKAAYAERMRLQREALKIGATSERDEAKLNSELKKANTKFELDMRKAGLYKASKLPNGELVLSVNPLGVFSESTTWVRKDTAGNLYESDITDKQTEMKKAYDLWREANLIKPREDRAKEAKDEKDEVKDEEALRREAVNWYTSNEANKKKLIERYDNEYAKFATNWNKGRTYTPVRDWQNVVDVDDTFKRFTREYHNAMRDPLQNQQEVVDKYKQLYPGLFDYASKIKDTTILSEYERVGRLSNNYTTTKAAPSRDIWYKHAKLIDLSAKDRPADEVIKERIEERKKLLGKSIEAPERDATPEKVNTKSNTNTNPNLNEDEEDLLKLMEAEGWGNL